MILPSTYPHTRLHTHAVASIAPTHPNLNRQALSVPEYVDTVLYNEEIKHMVRDAFSALHNKVILNLTFWDVGGGSLSILLNAMEYLQAGGAA